MDAVFEEDVLSTAFVRCASNAVLLALLASDEPRTTTRKGYARKRGRGEDAWSTLVAVAFTAAAATAADGGGSSVPG